MRFIDFKNKMVFTILTLFFFIFVSSCHKQKDSASLLCYVGGTMRPVMEELAALYEQKTGRKIHMDCAGSGELLIKMQQTKKGDLYVAHDPFLGALMNKGIGRHGWIAAAVDPVIVVPRGNPKNINGIRDLARPGIRIILPHRQYSTMGHIVSRMAEKAGLLDRLNANVVSRTRGGGEAANAVMTGAADASIVWNAVAYLRRDKLDSISIEPEYMLKKGIDAVTSASFGRIDMGHIRVTIATLKYSENIPAAKAFAEYVASDDAQAVWQKHGFSKIPAFARCIKPEDINIEGKILVHCAAGMRKPIAKLSQEFLDKHNVEVELNYDGTNRLLGQIKLTQVGDIYIAGDADYIEMAREQGLVKTSSTLCYFVPVIMVKKGNPRGIHSLSHLLRKGVKVGQGDEKAAAVGRLTPKILAINGIALEDWRKNVVLSTPTVNELGVAIKLGTIDAAVVWSSIAANYSEDSEIIALDPGKNIIPEVSGAVLAFSNNSDAASVFLRFIASERGRQVLAENGYVVERP
ncbi:MAG: extracellular solute-binding protein [bacterium]